MCCSIIILCEFLYHNPYKFFSLSTYLILNIIVLSTTLAIRIFCRKFQFKRNQKEIANLSDYLIVNHQNTVIPIQVEEPKKERNRSTYLSSISTYASENNSIGHIIAENDCSSRKFSDLSSNGGDACDFSIESIRIYHKISLE